MGKSPTDRLADDSTDPDPESADEQVLDELAAATARPVEPDTDAIERATSLPDQLTSRADETEEDLTVLFREDEFSHLTDGFVGSGDEDVDHISQNDGESEPDATGHERHGV